VDLVGACRAFLHVSEQGSFTQGAVAARVPQPVASRRVAALERHLGARLFDRSGRRAALTPFGREMLPTARRLVRVAEAFEDAAEQARRAPLRLALPDTCTALAQALLVAEARRHGIHIEPHPGGARERTEMLRSQEVQVTLLPVPLDQAAWHSPLGLAAASPPDTPRVYLEALRPTRARAAVAPRRVWLQPEDDVPHVRDPIMRARDAAGLRPTQVALAPSLTAATAEALGGEDLLLATAAQAEELGLYWFPLGGLSLSRGYAAATAGGAYPHQLRTVLADAIGHCLGLHPGEETR
jgi:DNA-binding transcriptional LysR family regulator